MKIGSGEVRKSHRAAIWAASIIGILSSAAAEWVQVNPTGPGSESGYEWTALHFVHPDTGWVVGHYRVSSSFNQGAILTTTDGGASWVLQHSGGGELAAVQFLDARKGWAMGLDGASSWRTTDGGANWIQMQGTGYAMDFADSLQGWMTDDNDGGWRTTDGGITWQILSGLTGSALDFANASVGWRISNGNVRKTTNGGVDWENQLYLAQASGASRAMHFLDASSGWVVGQSGQIRKTIDGGEAWTPQPSGTTRHLRSVRFADSNHGIACGYDVLLRTSNGGDTWVVADTTVNGPSQCFLSGSTVYGISGRRVFKYSSATALAPFARPAQAARFEMNRGSLRFTLARAAQVEIGLFDTRGKRTARLMDEPRSAGAHSLGLPENLAPGNYVLELRTDDIRKSIPVRID